MRILLLLCISLFILNSCVQKKYKYSIKCLHGHYYTDTIEKYGMVWMYHNSNGSEILITTKNGYDCVVDSINI